MLNFELKLARVIFIILLLKLFCLPLPELLPQEAYYWNYAKHLDLGYLDHPPLVGWLIWISTSIFGHSEFAVRLPALILSGFTAIFVFKLASAKFDRETGVIAALLSLSLPYFFAAGFFMSPDASLLFAWSGAIYFLYRALSAGDKSASQWGNWLAIGLLIGVGLISKYTIALVGFSTLAVITFNKDLRFWWRRPEPYLAVLVALMVFSPVIYWNAAHNWLSFAFQGPRRFSGGTEFATHLYFGHLLFLVTPVGICAAYRKLFGHDSTKYDFRQTFAIYYGLIPIAVFLLYSLQQETKPNWAGPAFLALLPLFARDFLELRGKFNNSIKSFFTKNWPAWLAISVGGYLVLAVYVGLGVPGIGYSPKMNRLVGWEDLGKKIVKLSQEVQTETKAWPIIIGMDKHYVPAGLSFYTLNPGRKLNMPDLDIAGRGLFGLESLMFDYWLPKGDLNGQPAILVARSQSDLEFPEVIQSFEKLGPATEYRSSRNGKLAGKYYYRIGYGLKVQRTHIEK